MSCTGISRNLSRKPTGILQTKKLKQEFEKYLIIRRPSVSGNKYTVNVIREKLATCGWMVLISDTVEDAQEALDI